MIPQEKSAAVTKGLLEAFGVTEFEDIRRLTKGQTLADVFRIVVKGSPYLLRIITDLQMRMIGPTRQFTCMKLAADGGLAPRVWYTSIEDGVSITDFVAEVPFPVAEALVRMPRLLRTLHALPPFPKVVDYLDTTCMFLLHKGAAVNGFFEKFKAANILSKTESDELFTWYEQLADAYPQQDTEMVSSHNDLFKPDNILFDGSRVWLVDWEAAFLNDRYADLAVVANLLVGNEEEERIYLQEYFGQPPDAYQLARYFLMQQIAHMFYAMGFMLLGSTGQPAQPKETVPEFGDYQRRMWAGEVRQTDKDEKFLYGRVHWEQLVKNMRQQKARFDEALAIVRDRAARHSV